MAMTQYQPTQVDFSRGIASAMANASDNVNSIGKIASDYIARQKADEQQKFANSLLTNEDKRQQAIADQQGTVFQQSQDERTGKIGVAKEASDLASKIMGNTNAQVPIQQVSPQTDSILTQPNTVNAQQQVQPTSVNTSILPNVMQDTNMTRNVGTYQPPTPTQTAKMDTKYGMSTLPAQDGTTPLLSNPNYNSNTNAIPMPTTTAKENNSNITPDVKSNINTSLGLSSESNLLDYSKVNLKDPLAMQMIKTVAPSLKSIDTTITALESKETDNTAKRAQLGASLAKYYADHNLPYDAATVDGLVDRYAPKYTIPDATKMKIEQIRKTIDINTGILASGDKSQIEHAQVAIQEAQQKATELYQQGMLKNAAAKLAIDRAETNAKIAALKQKGDTMVELTGSKDGIITTTKVPMSMANDLLKQHPDWTLGEYKGQVDKDKINDKTKESRYFTPEDFNDQFGGKWLGGTSGTGAAAQANLVMGLPQFKNVPKAVMSSTLKALSESQFATDSVTYKEIINALTSQGYGRNANGDTDPAIANGSILKGIKASYYYGK